MVGDSAAQNLAGVGAIPDGCGAQQMANQVLQLPVV